MPDPPKKTPEEQNWAEDQRERGYYYDDAHGYEAYDPADEDDEEASAGGSLDVDLDGTPTLLMEPDKTEKEPREVPDENGDPDLDGS
jgi:hypothetical protein